MMYFAYKLNKQDENIQLWHTSFQIWSQSIIACLVLTVASWPSNWFFMRQVRLSGIIISWRIFHSYLWSTRSNHYHGQWSRNSCLFLDFSCFFYDPVDVGSLTYRSSSFSKSSLNIWKFLVHILLKPSLENFEHFFVNMWNKYNCVVVWSFFGIAFRWDWKLNWCFPALWPLLSFPNLLVFWLQHFHSIIF